jgi:hypothetical protein
MDTSAASLLRRLLDAWREAELLHNGKFVPHVGVFEESAVTNDVDLDRHPLNPLARAGTSEEFPAMRTTEAIDENDLVYDFSAEHQQRVFKQNRSTRVDGRASCLRRAVAGQYWVLDRTKWPPQSCQSQSAVN